jgi:quercetin dioxygenase-like cupin family protein
MATLITRDDVRVTTSPNAVMTTLASPTLAGTEALSVWRVAMPAGNAGPVHTFDSEQVWSLLSGEAAITAGDERIVLQAGDTVRLPAGELRQVSAVQDVEFLVFGSGSAVVTAPGHPASGKTPPWIA